MSLEYPPVPIFYVYTFNMSLGYFNVPIVYAYTYNMSLGYFPVPILNVPFATRVLIQTCYVYPCAMGYGSVLTQNVTSILVT